MTFRFYPIESRSPISLVLVLLLQLGCASLQRPMGDWMRPVDLAIPPESLKDLRVALQCFAADEEAKNLERDHPDVCNDLGKLVLEMGGVIFDKDAEQAQGDPHFTLQYVELPGSRDFCGWTLSPFILSFALFPCIEDLRVKAQLRLLDDRGLLVMQRDLKYEERIMRGLPALAMLALKPVRGEGQRKQRLASYLVQTIKNNIYSYVQTRPDYAARLVKSF